MKQLHDRVVFEPVHVESLTVQERKRAMESLICLVEKIDGKIKGEKKFTPLCKGNLRGIESE